MMELCAGGTGTIIQRITDEIYSMKCNKCGDIILINKSNLIRKKRFVSEAVFSESNDWKFDEPLT